MHGLTSLFSRTKYRFGALIFALALVFTLNTQSQQLEEAGSSGYSDEKRLRVIVQPLHANRDRLAKLLSTLTDSEASWLRDASGNTAVYTLTSIDETPVSGSIVRQALTKLEQTGDIAYGQLDAQVHTRLLPDDQLFPLQWAFHDRSRSPASLNLVGAWEITTGSPDTVIAVVDTGVRFEHSDLTNRLLAGYDFVSGINDAPETVLPVDSEFNFARSNDNDGRDFDATDPGDGVSDNFKSSAYDAGLDCDTMDSTWHGTAMASLIAANANDGIGMTGVDWQASILPVRAVGRCGGNRSDLLDAIRWAAGVEDPSLPINPNPARIINLSLGINDICGPADQQAINDAIAAGAIIVAAAGNQGRNLDASPSAPADCRYVIGVGAVNSTGNRANYSNYGLDIDIVAPGGESQFGDGREILVAANAGSILPLPGSSHRYTSGTSVASPLVSGVLSLMLGANPALTNEELEFLLYESSRPFEPTIAGVRCDTLTCGAGMLDAEAAVSAAAQSTASPVNVTDGFRSREGSITAGTGGSAGYGCTIITVDNAEAKTTWSADSTLLLLLALLWSQRNWLRKVVAVGYFRFTNSATSDVA